MAEKDAGEPDEIETAAVEVVSEEPDESKSERSTLMKTVLLTVPLFCKFVIVLLIKFATDLIVYPLLFLYRLFSIGKRRILKLFEGVGKSKPPNGATS